MSKTRIKTKIRKRKVKILSIRKGFAYGKKEILRIDGLPLKVGETWRVVIKGSKVLEAEKVEDENAPRPETS